MIKQIQRIEELHQLIKMKNLVKFLGISLFLVSITFAAEAEEKNWSSLEAVKLYDTKASLKVGALDAGFKSGFKGISYDCKFALFSKCGKDEIRFAPAT